MESSLDTADVSMVVSGVQKPFEVVLPRTSPLSASLDIVPCSCLPLPLRLPSCPIRLSPSLLNLPCYWQQANRAMLTECIVLVIDRFRDINMLIR